MIYDISSADRTDVHACSRIAHLELSRCLDNSSPEAERAFYDKCHFFSMTNVI